MSRLSRDLAEFRRSFGAWLILYSSPTAASILKNVGSVGVSLIFWALGLLIAGTQLSVYLELASYFPNRSGAEVVYLEQAYPRPKYLLPTAFAVQSVLLSFSSSNAIGKLRYTTSKTMLILQSHGGVFVCDWWLYTKCLGAQRSCMCLHDFYHSL